MRLRFRLLAVLVAGVLSMALGGCSAQQQTDVQAQEQQLAINAGQSISFMQQQVSLAQAVVGAYQQQLALLPPGDKSAAKIQASLAKAQGTLVQAQLVLSMAKIGTDLLANMPPPATPAVQQPATTPAGATPAPAPGGTSP